MWSGGSSTSTSGVGGTHHPGASPSACCISPATMIASGAGVRLTQWDSAPLLMNMQRQQLELNLNVRRMLDLELSPSVENLEELRTTRWNEVNIMEGRTKKSGEPNPCSITGTLNLAGILKFSGIKKKNPQKPIWLKPVEIGFSVTFIQKNPDSGAGSVFETVFTGSQAKIWDCRSQLIYDINYSIISSTPPSISAQTGNLLHNWNMMW